jgi:MoaA/NifB/PqqE/SkfB family radical SAM enzyme
MTLATGMLGTTKKVLDFAVPFVRYRVSGRVTPVLAGYKITHRCNLTCLHCPYWRRKGGEQGFDGTIATLDQLHTMGIRILIFEGGEPLLWRDGNRSFEDVVREARKRFTSVCMTTNGTLPWKHLPLDRTWVSLDGPREIHDSIRGGGVFDRVWSNLTTEGRGRAFVSTTINRVNIHAIPELIIMLKGVVAGVTIQFHYPYKGLPDPLFVEPDERAPLLKELIRLKQLGYPVANSVLSLHELQRKGWTCEDRLLANAEPEGTVTQGCYLKNRGKSECALCGFSAHNEMSLAFRGSVQAIFTGMKIFFADPVAQALPSLSQKV